MPCNKIYDNYINKKNSQYSPRDEEVSLDKLEKVGRAPALALQKTWGATKLRVKDFQQQILCCHHCCSLTQESPHLHSCPIVVLLLTLCPHSLHSVANGYEATKTKLLTTYLLLH